MPDTRNALHVAVRELLEPVVRDILLDFIGDLRRGAQPREWLNMAELAEALDISRSSVKRLLDLGAPHIRVGELPRFKLSEVLEWLRNRGARNG